MFEYDICMCGDADKCPLSETCKRAEKVGPGIYTVSAFYEFYEEGVGCQYYWKKEEVDNK